MTKKRIRFLFVFMLSVVAFSVFGLVDNINGRKETIRVVAVSHTPTSVTFYLDNKKMVQNFEHTWQDNEFYVTIEYKKGKYSNIIYSTSIVKTHYEQ